MKSSFYKSSFLKLLLPNPQTYLNCTKCNQHLFLAKICIDCKNYSCDACINYTQLIKTKLTCPNEGCDSSIFNNMPIEDFVKLLSEYKK